MALTNWTSQRQETFSGSSQGVPSGCRAGQELDRASLVVSSSSKNPGERLLVTGEKEACLCGAQENSRACSWLMAESRENIITGW